MVKLHLLIYVLIIGLFGDIPGRVFGQEREAVEFDKLPFTDTSDDCIVEIDGKYLIKRQNETWIDLKDPCKVHKCQLGADGFPTENQFREFCYLTCNNEYEMQIIEGQCCGRCVKTKCKFNGAMYAVGETWKSADDCVMFECVQEDEGVRLLNYTKTCPPLPRNCALENIYIKDCCRLCNKTPVQKRLVKVQEQSSIYPDSYVSHPCKRTCQRNEAPRICKYTFTMEWYQAMSKACYDCPRNASHCSLPHCITGDGTMRSVMVINRMMPGPSIEVCFGDTIVVDVQNHLMGDTTTIHWHGLHQRETPYMDGVPFISQCGISPEQTFRYEFRADNVGTHFWHSHTGMQRGDGAFGALIIKQPIELDQHRGLYDVDSSDHHILLQDWDSVVGVSMFNAHHHAKGINKPRSILINGKGRLIRREESAQAIEARNIAMTSPPQNPYPPSSSIMKIRPEKVTVRTNVKSSRERTNADAIEDMAVGGEQIVRAPEDVDISDAELFSYPPSEKIQTMIEETVEDQEQTEMPSTTTAMPSTTTAMPKEEEEQTTEELTFTTTEMNENEVEVTTEQEEMVPKENIGVSLVREKRTLVENAELIPLHVFVVQKGLRYRFRLINAEFLNCPMELSIDDHTMTMIASDGSEFVPLVVDSFVSYAGERFDFILEANQLVGNYWIRIKGLMDCDERFTSAHQTAILRYSEAPAVEPDAFPLYNYTRTGVTLNALNRGQEDAESISIASVESLLKEDGDDMRLLQPEVDFKFYVYYDFYGKDNYNFHKPNMYGFNEVNPDQRLFSPQLNHISMKLPHFPLLPARHMIDEDTFCSALSLARQGRNCRSEFCQCPHVLEVPLNATVELVIVDEGYTYDANHPFHLHGNAFRVIGMERLNSSVDLEQVQELDRQGKLKRRLLRAPKKDTVTVPDGGYTIIRFVADNPGYWLFHCHIEFHAEIGMALVFKVGSHDEMAPVPPNFPTCYDYIPSNLPGQATSHSTGLLAALVTCLTLLQFLN